MSVIPINIYGDKILRKKLSPVKEIDFETVELIKNMTHTMREAYGIGLAANQVGEDKQIFVVDISAVEGYENFKPLAMINPKIVAHSEELEHFEEGCLSIPTLRADVIRPAAIQIVYFDTDMKEQTLEADELLARVIQHEYDHLQGVYFTDRLDPVLKKRVQSDLNQIRNRQVEVDYLITEKD